MACGLLEVALSLNGESEKTLISGQPNFMQLTVADESGNNITTGTFDWRLTDIATEALVDCGSFSYSNASEGLVSKITADVSEGSKYRLTISLITAVGTGYRVVELPCGYKGLE